MTDQDRVFDYIVKYKREHDGLSPGILELCRVTKILSNGRMSELVADLEREGRIVRIGKRKSGIMVVGGEWRWNGE